MYIDVSKLTEGNFNMTYNQGADIFESYQAELLGGVKVKGSFRKYEDQCTVSGAIEYKVKYPCAKCLKPVTRSYKLNFDEIFTSDTEGEYRIEDNKIDLTPIINENMVLNAEFRVLCKEDCRGLCPFCGTNLNINKCNCISIEDESSISPFAVLKDITTGGAKDGSTKKKSF